MLVTRYNGILFANLGLGGGTPDGAYQGPDIQPIDLERRGYNPVHVGVSRGPKPYTVIFTVKPGNNLEQAILNLLGAFDPLDETERILAGNLNDGTPVNAYATLGTYRGDNDNQVAIDFTLADPVWFANSATQLAPATWTPTASLIMPVVNSGKARTNLLVILRPTAVTAAGRFRFRRQFTITNNGDTPLRRFPLEVDLGNTTSWSGNPLPGQVWLFLDGLAQPATFIGVGQAKCFVWFLINECAPGQSLTYDVAWNAPGAKALSAGDAPAFDLTNEVSAANGFTSTTMTRTGAGWEPGQWARGKVTILSGPTAFQERYIQSNTIDTITLANSWGTIPAAGVTYLLRTSHNDRWIYSVRQTERSGTNDKRGIWYINRGQTKPSRALFDVPGGWFRMLYLDNNDEKNQSRWCPVIPPSGGTADYFAILDADRTAQGWASLQEEGQADSVAFSSPIPILGWRWRYQFKNPNGIGRAWFGCRESGAEDYETCLEDVSASNSLVVSSVVDMTYPDDMRHLIAHLGPANQEEIPVSWIRDTGSRTAGGTVTFFDDSKSWAPGQWVGGTLRIVSGTGAGQSRAVTASDVNSVTISPAWTRIPSDDSRYELRNKVLVAILRSDDTWEVRLDTTKIAVSAISAELTTFALEADFRLGGGTADVGVIPYQRIRLGLDGREVLVSAGEEVRIDGKRRRCSIYNNATGVLLRDVTSGIRLDDITTNGAFYSPDWLLIPPDQSPALNPSLVFPLLDASENPVTVAVTASYLAGWHG
jgi:hypothetical protein